ncbi:hypothetical protein SAMN05192559_102378 [Halobacillus karajensis]|uniref:hypothetical protein n=1 Tax=Halobacillus karajensis TaxID=195088 RepID=UPI0008A7C7EA|nr:hypothetical protein [Halobacillus karajensis]SEH63100.1 hypothetical protein SAMN05192559_102378 [Halobacillus karajensis]
MKKIYSVLVLFAIFVVIGYMDSPNQKPEDSIHYPLSTDEKEKETVAVEGNSAFTTMELELVQEGTKMVDGAKVEAYREYEIYKNSDGKVIKKVPTDHYQYLKYKD